MRIAYMGNNRLGWQVLAWLKQQGEEIIALILHPASERRFGKQILQAVGLSSKQVFDGSTLGKRDVVERLKKLEPDIGISVLFGHVLKPDFIKIFPDGCINLHPSYLPYNRGANPNIWSIVEKTPAGTTLHYIDAHIDTGAIIAQRQVEVEPIDTGKTLYYKLEQASFELFKETWPLIKTRQVVPKEQATTAGTYHHSRDVQKIDEIHPDKLYRAQELIDILRARTYPPYSGAFMTVGGRKVYLRLELMYEETLEGNDE